MTQMLLWMTVALSCMTVGLACRCAPLTNQTYCNNDIVFRGRPVVQYPDTPEGLRIYTVKVRRIFWLLSNSNLLGITTYNLTTTSTSAACGASFQLNTSYVIAATEANGDVYTNLCLGNMAWNSLNRKQKRFFRTRLRRLCAEVTQ